MGVIFNWTFLKNISSQTPKSDSDIPIFVTELQILVHIISGHVKKDDNGNCEQGY